MIGMQSTVHKAQSISIKEYASNLARRGIRIIPGESDTFWAEYLFGGMRRFPIFHSAPPTSDELRHVLWRGRATIASYLLEPDERHPANGWIYVCTDQNYSLEKLTFTMRKNVRRGLNELIIAPLTPDQVLAHGLEAFCDTRRKHGRSNGTPEGFREHINSQASWPEIAFLGAWKDNQLAAFLSIIEVEDWVEFYQIFSMDALLQYRPNDALMYSALSHYLVERKCRLVYSGISSLHAERNAAGLYRFKTKVGLEARPVHRAFVPHPLLRPLANRLTLWGINAMVRFKPGDLRLKKAGGVLACMLGDTSGFEAATRRPVDE